MQAVKTSNFLMIVIALSCCSALGAEHKLGSDIQSDLRQLLTFKTMLCAQTSSLKLSQPTRNGAYAAGQETYTVAQQAYEKWVRALTAKGARYRTMFQAAQDVERVTTQLLALHARAYGEESDVMPPFVVFTASLLELTGKHRDRVIATLNSDLLRWPAWAELR